MSVLHQQHGTLNTGLPETLPILRTRLTLRLLADGPLPAYKGGMLRGGFGYAFQRVVCPPPCQGHADRCAVRDLCPYHQLFEPTHPADNAHLHHLRDIPRAFVLDLSEDRRVAYRAGDVLEWTVVLFGTARDALPHFIAGFVELGRLGLGERRIPARLERAEVLEPWQVTGVVVYQDGRVRSSDQPLPFTTTTMIAAQADALSPHLQLTFTSPLRLQVGGTLLYRFDFPALVRALCWRLHALSIFYGGGPWEVDHWARVEQAHAVVVKQSQIRWADWGRTSTRGPERRDMKLGGIEGTVRLRNVPAELRPLLLAGSLVHVGKACVFGHGSYRLENL